MVKTPRNLVVRAARLYWSNAEAAQALGITPRAFARICRELEVETPWVRQRRARRKCSAQNGRSKEE